MVQQLSNVARLFPFSTSFILILLTLNIMHVALCCKMATALGIQVHIQGRKKGAVARCHSAVPGLTRVSPEMTFIKAHLNLIGQTCHMVIQYYKEGWRASTFLMALD